MKSKRSILVRCLLSFMSATGLLACQRQKITFAPCAYGPAYYHQKISGTVTDSLSNPIKGIKVKDPENNDSVYTSADGTFCLENAKALAQVKVTLEFSDIDGENNGGEFMNKNVKVKNPYVDDQLNWEYPEIYDYKDVNVVMEKKENK